jgi:hypothetical protein
MWDTMHHYPYLCFLILAVNDAGQVEQFGSLSTNIHHTRRNVASSRKKINCDQKYLRDFTLFGVRFHYLYAELGTYSIAPASKGQFGPVRQAKFTVLWRNSLNSQPINLNIINIMLQHQRGRFRCKTR